MTPGKIANFSLHTLYLPKVEPGTEFLFINHPEAPMNPEHPQQPITKSTIVTWGKRTRTLGSWPYEPDLWLRGLDLDVLLARLAPEDGSKPWTVAEAFLTAVPGFEDTEYEAKITSLLSPPNGNKGWAREVRAVRRRFLDGSGGNLELVPAHAATGAAGAFEVCRRELEAQRTVNTTLTTKIYTHEDTIRDLRRQLELEREKTKHLPELAALFGWWNDVATEGDKRAAEPQRRIFALLTRMFNPLRTWHSSVDWSSQATQGLAGALAYAMEKRIATQALAGELAAAKKDGVKK